MVGKRKKIKRGGGERGKIEESRSKTLKGIKTMKTEEIDEFLKFTKSSL